MILFFLLLLEKVAGNAVLTGPKVVKQCAGRSVQIVCRYHSFYRDNVKYWCKGYYFNFCTTLVRTDGHRHADGPLEVTDNKNAGLFTVRFKKVQAEDAGWYWCAVERVSRHVSTSMELTVLTKETPQCFVPEPTTLRIRDITTLPTTLATTTPATTTPQATTMPATTESAFPTETVHEVTTEGIRYTETGRLAYEVWIVLRWVLFAGLCLYLSCFILYFELRHK